MIHKLKLQNSYFYRKSRNIIPSSGYKFYHVNFSDVVIIVIVIVITYIKQKQRKTIEKSNFIRFYFIIMPLRF